MSGRQLGASVALLWLVVVLIMYGCAARTVSAPPPEAAWPHAIFNAIEQQRTDSIRALSGRWGFSRPVAAAVWDAALAHGRDPELVASLVAVESGGDSTAVSQAGARGLIQVLPTTANFIGFTEPRRLFEARYNLDAGLTYLREMEELFGSLGYALKAYNAGPEWAEWHAARGYRVEDMWYPRTVLAIHGD